MKPQQCSVTVIIIFEHKQQLVYECYIFLQLQLDFSSGKLKPGLNVALPASIEKHYINDVVSIFFYYVESSYTVHKGEKYLFVYL